MADDAVARRTRARLRETATEGWRAFLREYEARVPAGHEPASRAHTRRHGGLDIGPPATDAALAELERVFGRPVEPAVRGMLTVTNGAFIDMGTYSLASARDMAHDFAGMVECFESPAYGPDDASTQPPGVKPGLWRRGWLPIGSDGGGNHLVVDHDPDVAHGGVAGQLLNWDHEGAWCTIVAPSLLDWVAELTQALQSGSATWDARLHGGCFTGWPVQQRLEAANRLRWRGSHTN